MIKRLFKKDIKRNWELVLSFESMKKLGVIVPIISKAMKLDNRARTILSCLEVVCEHEVRCLPEANQSIDEIYETLIVEYKCNEGTVFIGNGLHVVDHILIQFDPKLVPLFPEDTSIKCKIESVENLKKVVILDAKMTDDEATLLTMRGEFDEIKLKKSFWTKFKELFVKS